MPEPNDNSMPEQDFYAPIDVPETQLNGEEFVIDEPQTLDYFEDAPTKQPQQEQKPPIDPQDPQGKRFAHWQSEAMREANARKDLERQLNEINPYIPIVRYIQENPNILDTIESSLGQPQAEQPKGPERPVPPTKPDGFNKAESFNDPESESFKYREANETYREQLAEFLLNKEQQREEEYKRAQEERKMVEQRNAKLQGVATQLTTQYGFSQNDAAEFISLYDNDKVVTLDNLVQLYKIQKGKVAPQTNPKVQQMLQRQGKQAPLPAGINGGETQMPVSDEEIFNASIHQSAVNQGSILWRNKKR